MVTVNLIIDSDVAAKDVVKIKEAANLLARAWNTEEFKEFVLKFNYEHVWYTGSLWWKQRHSELVRSFYYTDLTKEQVYQKLMDCAEDLSPVKDQEIDICIDTYYKNNGVIGYTYPNTKWQWINLKFFKNYTAADVASNFAHEFAHKLGFDHEYNFTNNRQYSVPYAVGYKINEICNKLLKQEK